ncbi:hypothetical protein [Paenibacillus sp. N3.4]|uniref:hypothetical protein n=1 Tax=Paenibacillus sp. N3.4 TaxID=2603222 RepID=UPI00164F29D4|nr:hypothetical protein [Paenibacillus sp. N3.4]
MEWLIFGNYKDGDKPPFRIFKEGEVYNFTDEEIYLSDLEIESVSLFRKLHLNNQEEVVEIIKIKLTKQWN